MKTRRSGRGLPAAALWVAVALTAGLAAGQPVQSATTPPAAARPSSRQATGASAKGAPTRPAAPQPACEFRLDEDVLRVKTDRYEMAFRFGAMTSLTNRLTGEKYTVDAGEVEGRLKHAMHGLATRGALAGGGEAELQTIHKWAGSYDRNAVWASLHHPTSKSRVVLKRLAPNRVVATWTGLQAFKPEKFFPQESYALDLEVLVGSGELQVRVTAAGDAPGVYGNGFLMANFSPDLRFVLPRTHGYSFRPKDQKPGASSTHWPHPWHASLVIAEGKAGSVGLWMADPLMRDRYLHDRNNGDSYDVMFESVNDAPFDGHRRAVSRPIRINVYHGNWTRPARAFRDWWAETFHVKPIDQREPKWLRDSAFVSPHYTLPPTEMIPRGIFWAPQHWKVQPTVGDGGLFPDVIEKGPELAAVKDSWPKIRQHGGHLMVYLNINHMREGHPSAGKYWKSRLIPPFGKRPIEREPRFQAAGSFLVNSADKGWQDLIIGWAEQTYKRFGIRGFYMDCSAGVPNSLQGTIGGRNDCQGQVEIMRRMKERIPGCWQGVEYVTEVNATVADTGFVGYDSWWPGSLAARENNAHPILGFLFNRYVHLWYIHDPSPAFDEVMGRLANTSIRVLGDDYVTDYSASETFGEFFARLRWRTSMKPVYPDHWDPKVRAYYSDPEGNRYRVLSERPTEGRMVRTAPDGAEELVYWRIRGRRTAKLSGGTGIEGWCAYEGESAIGLNPEAAYLYAAKPRSRDWEVTRLPEDSYIDVARPYRNGLLVLELKSHDGKEHSGIVELRTTHKIVLGLNRRGRAALQSLGQAGGRNRYRIDAQVPGAVAFAAKEATTLSAPAGGGAACELWKLPMDFYADFNGSGLRVPIPKRKLRQPDPQGTVFLFPPWQTNAAVDYLLALPKAPAGKKLLLQFKTKMPAHAGNNAVLVVSVNGREFLSEKLTGAKVPAPRPHVADLTEVAGTKVLLTLQARRGYLFDWVHIQKPVIVVAD